MNYLAGVLLILVVAVSSTWANAENPKTGDQGICSWYGAEGEIPPGHPTACNEGFDRFAMKVAHKSLPCGTRLRVTNDDNGKTVDVVVNDRLPQDSTRLLDLTYAAFGAIEDRDKGITRCGYEIL